MSSIISMGCSRIAFMGALVSLSSSMKDVCLRAKNNILHNTYSVLCLLVLSPLCTDAAAAWPIIPTTTLRCPFRVVPITACGHCWMGNAPMGICFYYLDQASIPITALWLWFVCPVMRFVHLIAIYGAL